MMKTAKQVHEVRLPGYTVIDTASGLVLAFRSSIGKAYAVADRYPRFSTIVHLVKATQAEVEALQRAECGRALMTTESREFAEVFEGAAGDRVRQGVA